MTNETTTCDPAPRLRTPVLIVLLVSLVCAMSTLWLPLGRDHGIGLYIADVMLDGGAPYKDAWEIRPPGIFYFYAAAITAFGKNALALRLLDLLTHVLTALALFHLGRRLFGVGAGLVAGVVYPIVYFFGNDFWNLGNTDGSVALPSVLALLCLLGSRRGPRPAWDLLAGVLMGVVFLVRFTHGLLYLPVLALLFASGAHVKPCRFGSRFRRLVVVSLGFVGCLGLFLTHMGFKGALGDFFYTLFVFAPKYAVLTYDGDLMTFLKPAVRLHALFVTKYILVTIPALLGCLWIAVRERTAPGLAAVLWLVSALLGMEVMAKFYAYHWLPLFAPLSLLAGFLIHRVLGSLRRGSYVVGIIGLVVLAYCAGSFTLRFGPVAYDRYGSALALSAGTMGVEDYRGRFDTWKRGSDFSATANYTCAAYLKQQTRPDDPVFIWGFETLIYYLADRRPPTRFCSNYPIVAKWHRQDWYEELLQTLKDRPPAYVLLVTHDAMPWITGHSLDSLGTLRARFPELRDFIDVNYELEATIENIHVCRLRKG